MDQHDWRSVDRTAQASRNRSRRRLKPNRRWGRFGTILTNGGHDAQDDEQDKDENDERQRALDCARADPKDQRTLRDPHPHAGQV